MQFIFLLHLIELLCDAIQITVCLELANRSPAAPLYVFTTPPQPLLALFLIRGCEKTIGLIKGAER